MEESKKIVTLFLLVTSLILISVVSRGKSSQEVITTGQVVVSGTWGKEPGQFGLQEEKEEVVFYYGPTTFTVDNQGNIYVADDKNHRIQKFDRKGNLLLCFGSKGEKDDQFWLIEDIAVDNEGKIFVADFKNSSVKIFNSKGRYLSSIKSEDIGIWRFRQLASVDVDTEGNIYIVDSYEKMYKLNKQRQLISTHDWDLPIVSGKGYRVKRKGKGLREIEIEVYNIEEDGRKRLSKKMSFAPDVVPSIAHFEQIDEFGNIYVGYDDSAMDHIVTIARLNPAGKMLRKYNIELKMYYRQSISIKIAKNGDIYIMKSTKDKFWIERIPYRPR